MHFPSGVLVEDSSIAKGERAKSERLACDLVEPGVCQLVVKVVQRVSMKPRLTSSASDRSQYSPNTALEGFQRGIEYGIEDLVEGPVVVGRDDQMAARFQNTEDLQQESRQRLEPLEHTDQNDQVKRGVREWRRVDVTQLREYA